MCGIQYEPGQTYIVLAKRDAAGALATGGCRSGTQFPLVDYERAAGAEAAAR